MRRVSGWWMLFGVMVLVGALSATAWQLGRAMLLTQTVGESRTVADLAEVVGRWASQYGGVHVRTQGVGAGLPGSFLTRSVYALSGQDAGVLQGVKAEDRANERKAMDRVEAYHWKNPALIQREVADTLAAAGSRSQYRLTARTVLNRNNAPNPFELEALTAIKANFDRLTPEQAKQAVKQSASGANMGPLEFWRVDGDRLLYARAVIAQGSCLKCHDTPDKAPAFLKANQQFNGGGGFGYQVGKPAGVISVTVPLLAADQLVEQSMTPMMWLTMAAAGVAAVGLVVLAVGLIARGASARRAA